MVVVGLRDSEHYGSVVREVRQRTELWEGSTSITSKTHTAGRSLKLGTGDFAKGSRKAECNSQALCHVKRCNCKGLPAETTSSSWP